MYFDTTKRRWLGGISFTPVVIALYVAVVAVWFVIWYVPWEKILLRH